MRYYAFAIERRAVYVPISRIIQIEIEHGGAKFFTQEATYIVPFRAYKNGEENKDWLEMADFLNEEARPFPGGSLVTGLLMKAVEIKKVEE